MKVYISAPYSKGDMAKNVARAINAADILVDDGYTPYVPHLTHFWHMLRPRSYEYWLKYDIEWLDDCDVILRLSGESAGADVEVEHALERGIPVVLSINELRQTFPIKDGLTLATLCDILDLPDGARTDDDLVRAIGTLKRDISDLAKYAGDLASGDAIYSSAQMNRLEELIEKYETESHR